MILVQNRYFKLKIQDWIYSGHLTSTHQDGPDMFPAPTAAMPSFQIWICFLRSRPEGEQLIDMAAAKPAEEAPATGFYLHCTGQVEQCEVIAPGHLLVLLHWSSRLVVGLAQLLVTTDAQHRQSVLQVHLWSLFGLEVFAGIPLCPLFCVLSLF